MGERATWNVGASPEFIERKTLCFSRPEEALVLHKGDEGFGEDAAKLFSVYENNAAEQLIELKEQLRRASADDFWHIVTEGLASIAGAQCAFVSKRVLVDEENAAIEMPPIGETGSCLMATALYFSDGAGYSAHLPKNFKYHAYGCPCAYMRHDKVFIIPERLNEFITNNPNELPIPGEAYMGIPLVAEGKCFAHFGVMWSADGAARRKLGWGYLEMLFHSLEDIILERIIEGKSFKKPDLPQRKASQVIPHGAITAVQSLKPYARSLSHELRTPMQGVVGMLDVMYATVSEAAEGQTNPQVQQVLQTLRENIEVVQDSSRRAVEAADNVVHAYDLNMSVPDSALSPLEEEAGAESPKPDATRSEILTSDSEMSETPGLKRRREDHTPWTLGNASKTRVHDFGSAQPASRRNNLKHVVKECSRIVDGGPAAQSIYTDGQASSGFRPPPLSAHSSTEDEQLTLPTLRHTSLRDVMRYVVNESLKVGGRPESTFPRETAAGQVIEVRTRTSGGVLHTKIIEWVVDAPVPDTIFVDERELAKLISCVFLNAVKFTEEGRITVTAKMSRRGRYVVINVKDTGPGIPAAFLPNLFKPFSREDDSLTRQQEGLGLGLLVAKGLSRRLGGDLLCVHADTSGPNRGSEFEIRVPISPAEASRPSSPFPSPRLSTRRRFRTDAGGTSRDISPVAGPSQNLEHEPATLRNQPRSLGATPAIPALALTPQTDPQRKASSPPLLDHATLLHTGTPPPDTATSPAPKRKISFNRNLATTYPLTFLVAEDNKINRALLVNMLRKLGYPPTSIYEAYDGAEAVKQVTNIEAAGRSIDVVLMDLWMPHMDGYEAAERILSMHKARRDEGGDYFHAHAAVGNQPDDDNNDHNSNIIEGTVGSLRRPSITSIPPLSMSSTESIPSSVQTSPDDSLLASSLSASSDAITGVGEVGAKARKARKPPKILAVTADVTEDALGRAARVGMTGYMTKPYKILDLERLIEGYCGPGAE